MNTFQSIDRLRRVLRRQHKALATESAYVYWLSRYISEVCQMPSTFTSTQKVERFLSLLACRDHVSASTQNQAFNAIVFFYKEVLGQPLENIDALRARRPVRMRHAPSVDDTHALLKTIRDQGGYPTRMIAAMLYGCGLRVCEPLNMRIKDVNLTRCTLCIRGAKGGKDRVVALPSCLQQPLQAQMQAATIVWERDQRDRIPTMLPEQLAKKYPEYQFSWPWAWIFPAHDTCRDPRSLRIVRYRMHEAHVQRAVKDARRELGISVLPHELRHGYATHCLERGANPRAIQEAS